MTACPPANLVEPSELSRFNVPGQFLAQFAPLPLQVKIATGGALGAMTFVYRVRGEEYYTNTAVVSTAGATWAWTIDDQPNTFAVLTFAAGTYVADTTYTVDPSGAVTDGSGAFSGLTATRFDLRDTTCSAVTREALLLMRNAVKAPLLAWTDDAKMHAAAMCYAALKRGRGFTANQAGIGDENILAAESLGRAFFLSIGEQGKPDDWTDSSPTTDGPMFAAYPTSATPRGWRGAW